MTAVEELQKKIGAKIDGSVGKEVLTKAMAYWKINKDQVAHLFGQTAHETGDFKLFVENLNYSADGLRKIFPKYFPTQVLANAYARNPEKIGSRVYANRMGNRDEASKDGFFRRGVGALQLTGNDNQLEFSKFMKEPRIYTNPELIATEYAFDSAIFFFTRNKLWALCKDCSDASILSVTKRINGGVNGLADRVAKTKKYRAMLD